MWTVFPEIPESETTFSKTSIHLIYVTEQGPARCYNSVMVMQVTDSSQFLPTAKESNHIPTIDFKLLQNYLPPFISAEYVGAMHSSTQLTSARYRHLS